MLGPLFTMIGAAFHGGDPKAYNVISSTGGWNLGASGPWNSYISVQNNQTIVADPGVLYLNNWEGQVVCSLAGNLYNTGTLSDNVAGFTQIQHNYPRNPLSVPCFVSGFFDDIRNGRRHNAEDIVKSDGHGSGTALAIGDPVYAMEGGTVTASIGNNGPAPTPYPQCAGAPGNYVKIRTSDNYSTVYFHVKPLSTIQNGVPVSQGQQNWNCG